MLPPKLLNFFGLITLSALAGYIGYLMGIFRVELTISALNEKHEQELDLQFESLEHKDQCLVSKQWIRGVIVRLPEDDQKELVEELGFDDDFMEEEEDA